jgi:hypothetical protein
MLTGLVAVSDCLPPSQLFSLGWVGRQLGIFAYMKLHTVATHRLSMYRSQGPSISSHHICLGPVGILEVGQIFAFYFFILITYNVPDP